MTVKILSEETINKIAAGEVVERPLNAVKELLENSLDALASKITVEISAAGRQLIRVSDNGTGISKEDLSLILKRHATSKISDFNDLGAIHSLGFRGEALASIAAVSRFEVKSIARGSAEGWSIKAEGGKVSPIMPASVGGGTIMEVKDLFYNTPARKKFLKTDATEKSRIFKCVEEIALSEPNTAFKLISDGKTVFQTASTENKLLRISDILGKDFAQKLARLKIEHNNISVEMYFTKRAFPLKQKNCQYLFVNGRAVNLPKWFAHAVYNAYREFIPHDAYAGIVCYITIDSSEIDINIHPTKREIKFAAEREIYDLIFGAVRRALSSDTHSEISISAPNGAEISRAGAPKAPQASPMPSLRQTSHDALYKPKTYTVEEPSFSAYNALYSKPAVKQTEFVHDDKDNLKVIGQVFDAYIIAQKGDSLYIFDQHASAERVKYEHYLKQASTSVKLQQMLIGETFELSASLAEILKENIKTFNDLGIIVEEFGDKTFRISAYPALFGANVSVADMVKRITENLETEKPAENAQQREKIIRFACRASVKAGDALNFEEAKQLIKSLFSCTSPLTCPHGRPTAYKITLNEIEKFFKRK
jgi:DNA mismatch repair protein MutL